MQIEPGQEGVRASAGFFLHPYLYAGLPLGFPRIYNLGV
jgi:hypothetical protein